MSLPPPTLPRCYRHPDRETGRACTRCGKPACPDCLRTVSIGSQCVDCIKAARPDVATRVRFWNARQPTLVTFTLMAINIAIYIWTVTAGNAVALCPPFRAERATCVLGLNEILVSDGGWYRLVSSGFLHFTPFHILMNMLLLFQLGQMLEPVIGRVRFGLLYGAGLLGGSAAALLMQGPFDIGGGASGAVFGLMAAAAIGFHRRGINVFATGVGITLVLNIVLTFTIPGISIGAHLGGAIAGAIAGFVVLAPRHKAPPVWQTYATPALVMVASVVLAIVAVN